MAKEEKDSGQKRIKIWVLLGMVVAACIAFAGCSILGPISLNHAVLNYDSNVLKSQEKLLLLNIVRMHDDQPSHFTVSNDIRASFTFSSGAKIGPAWNVTEPGINSLGLELNATGTESPTITITPMEGKDFAARLLRPLDGAIANMVLSQKGREIDKLLRLIGHSFLLSQKDTEGKDIYRDEELKSLAKEHRCFEKDPLCLLVNRPPQIPLKGEEPDEKTQKKYELFRQVVLHIKTLERTGLLHFTPLEFEFDIEGTFSKDTPSVKDITDALDKQIRFTRTKQPSEEGWKLTRTYTILALSDFPLEKSDKSTLQGIAKDFTLSDHIKLDQSVIIVWLKDKGKSKWPIYGLFRLRNFAQILQFLAESLKEEPGYHRELHVAPSKFTKALSPLQPGVFDNPPLTLEIHSGEPLSRRDVAVSVSHNGESFWISSSQRWNRQVFTLLYEIFQMNRIEQPISPTLFSISK